MSLIASACVCILHGIAYCQDYVTKSVVAQITFFFFPPYLYILNQIFCLCIIPFYIDRCTKILASYPAISLICSLNILGWKFFCSTSLSTVLSQSLLPFSPSHYLHCLVLHSISPLLLKILSQGFVYLFNLCIDYVQSLLHVHCIGFLLIFSLLFCHYITKEYLYCFL